MLLRLAVGSLLFVHGFVHVRLWLWGVGSGPPNRSWLFGEVRAASVALAILAGTALTAAGLGAVAGQNWWPNVALAGSLVSVVLIVLVVNRWLSIGLAIDAILIGLALRSSGG